MKNEEDEQQHNADDAGTSMNCDNNVHTNEQNETQNEEQNRCVAKIYSKDIKMIIVESSTNEFSTNVNYIYLFQLMLIIHILFLALTDN